MTAKILTKRCSSDQLTTRGYRRSRWERLRSLAPSFGAAAELSKKLESVAPEKQAELARRYFEDLDRSGR